MDTLILEKQAWALRIKLNWLIEAEIKGFAVRYSTPTMKLKLCRVHKLSYSRFLRRQSKFFNYQPDGFAPSSALSSGVVGQGTLS